MTYTIKYPRYWIILFSCIFIINFLLFVDLAHDQPRPRVLGDANTEQRLTKAILFKRRSYKLTQDDFHGLRIVNPHPFKYIHTSHDICSSKLHEKPKSLFLLVLVKSSAGHFALRNAIRKTWGTFSEESAIQIRFLLGYDPEIQSYVRNECAEHRDIIQEDFYDAYENNTYKTIMGYNWVVQFCSNARYIFFVDDDMFVNIDNVIDYFEQVTQQEESELFSGMLISWPIPVRNSQSKWFVPWEEYPFYFYPPYLSGGAILTSQLVVRQFKMIIPYVSHYKIDDVYLGIIAKKLSITPTENRLIDSYTLRNMANLKSLIANHGFDNPDLYIWTYAVLHNRLQG